MKVDELITEVNKYVEDLDFVTARRLIESNLELLNQNRFSLKRNARDLLKIVLERKTSGVKPLSRNDIATLMTINSYATNFDLISLKLIVRNNPKLLLQKEAVQYLNKDARVILEGMGAISE